MSRRIGLTQSNTISITVYDSDRIVSNMLNCLKKHYSKQGVNSPEMYRILLMKGITARFDELMTEQEEKESNSEIEILQKDLFENEQQQ